MALNNPSFRKLKVAVLYGGVSSEREISVESGKEVSRALKDLGHSCVEIDVQSNVASKVAEARPDVAFIALHGSPGEDGAIQGLLEILGVRYTGSGILASSLGMDKAASKKIFVSAGLPVPRYVEAHDNGFDASALGFPLVVKPSCEGSSVGVSIVKRPEDLGAATTEALKLGGKILLEEYIEGREIQCGILGNANPEPLEPIEIVPKKEFFDFEAKYDPSLAEEIVPAPITEGEKKIIQDFSTRAYKAIGCRGFARVDNFLTPQGKVYVSEINTIPGLTKNSLFPKEALASGYDFKATVQKIIELAME